MLNFITAIGRIILTFIRHTGKLGLFFIESICWLFQPPWYGKQIGAQLMKIGYFSLPVVGLTAIFTGMVLALQSYTGFSRFSAEGAVATVVV